MRNPLNSFGDTARETQARHPLEYAAYTNAIKNNADALRAYNDNPTAENYERAQRAADAELDSWRSYTKLFDEVADAMAEEEAAAAKKAIADTPTPSIFLDDVAADEPELLDADAHAQLLANTVDNLEEELH